MQHFLNFSNAIPYILYHFVFSKSTSTRHHQTIKKLGIIQFLMDCSIWFRPNKILNCHGNGVITLYLFQTPNLWNFSIHLHCVNCQLPPFLAKVRALATSGLISSCRGSLSVYNAGQTNFVSPSEHKLWLIM